MPEYTESPLFILDLVQGLHGLYNPKILVVLGHQFDQASLGLHEKRVIFHQIQKTLRFAGPADHGIKRDDPFLAFTVDLLPVCKMFPSGGNASDLTLTAIGKDDQGVVPEELRDSAFVVGEIVCVSRFQSPMSCLKLHEHQGQSIDETNQIGAPGVHLAGNPELGGQEIIVICRIIPVNHFNDLNGVPITICIRNLYLYAVFDKLVDLTVGLCHAHARAVADQLLDCQIERLCRQIRIQFLQNRTEAGYQNDHCLGLSTQRTSACLVELMEAVSRLPPKFCEQNNCGLFNQSIF